tara:strand:+ start:7205 stop:7387 length:183 start_codon:yes stop_codon:yes gene_type:complete
MPITLVITANVRNAHSKPFKPRRAKKSKVYLFIVAIAGGFCYYKPIEAIQLLNKQIRSDL